jgi:hypothetical protein
MPTAMGDELLPQIIDEATAPISGSCETGGCTANAPRNDKFLLTLLKKYFYTDSPSFDLTILLFKKKSDKP